MLYDAQSSLGYWVLTGQYKRAEECARGLCECCRAKRARGYMQTQMAKARQLQ